MNTIQKIFIVGLGLGCIMLAQAPADLLPQYVAALNGVTNILATVKDEASAKSAQAKLDAAVTQLNAVKAKLKQTKLHQEDTQHAALMKDMEPKLKEASQKLHDEIHRIEHMPKLQQQLSATLTKL